MSEQLEERVEELERIASWLIEATLRGNPPSGVAKEFLDSLEKI